MPDTIRNEDRARRVVCQHLGVEPERVTDDATFMDDLGADSLDVVELTVQIEEEFDLLVGDDDAEKIFSVGTFRDLVRWLDEQRVVS